MHPADQWRLAASMRTGASGACEDDMERFFRRPPSEVSDADVWRWRAACLALRRMTGEAK